MSPKWYLKNSLTKPSYASILYLEHIHITFNTIVSLSMIGGC